jgi:hypothetical protein
VFNAEHLQTARGLDLEMRHFERRAHQDAVWALDPALTLSHVPKPEGFITTDHIGLNSLFGRSREGKGYVRIE